MGRSLNDYATRRFRFSGKDQLAKADPYFKSIDDLRDGRESGAAGFVSFANYDYIGAADHPDVQSAAGSAIRDFGVGALASRLIGGERRPHRAFESALAAFIGTDAALTIVSGYLANSSTIAHLMDSRDALFIDELSHHSLHAGTRGSPARKFVFRHADLGHLEELLRTERAGVNNAMIIAEGLYSMDGDIADLPALVELKIRHDAWLLLDEAHSIGVLGENGRGACEHWKIDPHQVDLIIGTLSKSFASCGGFIAGDGPLIEWLRYTLPGFVYSVGMSPVITAAAHAALNLLIDEPWRLERLRQNSDLFVRLARARGLDVGPCEGIAIIPILLGSNEEAMSASDAMLRSGYYVPPIIQVGVPKDKPRLRFFLSATHAAEDIRRAVLRLSDILAEDRRELQRAWA